MNNIKMLRQAFKMTSEELAQKIGISQPTMSKIENGLVPLTVQRAQKIAKLFNISLNEVTNEDLNLSSIGNKLSAITDFFSCNTGDHISIKVIDFIFKQGQLIEKEVGLWNLPKIKYFSLCNISPDYIRMIDIKSDSMSPTLKENDWILFDLSCNNFGTDGLYLLELSNIACVRRLQGMPGNNIMIKSDNDRYTSHVYPIDDIKILGKLVCILKAERFGFKHYCTE